MTTQPDTGHDPITSTAGYLARKHTHGRHGDKLLGHDEFLAVLDEATEAIKREVPA